MKRVRGVAAVAAGVALLAGCGAGPKTAATPSSSSSSVAQVVFEVEGEETYGFDGREMSVDVTMGDPSGVQQGTGKTVPLGVTGGPPGLRRSVVAGSAVTLSAQIASDEAGTVTCRITSDGVVVSENTSSGKYAVVSCRGRA